MATHSSVLVWRIPGTESLVGCHLWGRTESDTTEATQQQQLWTEYTLPNDSYLPLSGGCEYVTSVVKRTLQVRGIKVRIGDTIFVDYLSGPDVITSILLKMRQLSQLVLEARTQSCSDAKRQLGVKEYR